MPYFIGYTTLEGWLKAIATEFQVYAMLQMETVPAHLCTRRKYVICLAQPVDDEVHYFRKVVGVTEWVGDHCVNEKPSREVREERAEQAWALVQWWLMAHKLQWHEAAVAVPVDVRDGLLDGEAGFLGYDPEKGYYRRAEIEAPGLDQRPAPIKYPA